LQAKEIQARGESLQGDYALAISNFEKGRDLFEQLGDSTEAGIAEIWAAQVLPDVAKVAEGRKRLLALIATAEAKKYQVLLPAAYYWLGISDGYQNEISEENKHCRLALHLAAASHNSFEVQHAEDNLATNYSELNELEPALFYAGKMLNDRDLYFVRDSQYWREKKTLSRLSLKLGFNSTALNFSQEALAIARDLWPGDPRVNDSLNGVIAAAAAMEDPAALKYANESMQLALKQGSGAENTRTTAKINLLLADVSSRNRDCQNALNAYDQALELYRRLPEVTDSLYQIHRGKLFCFQQLDRQTDFAVELKTVLGLAEEYRATIREDDSRQAFFAGEQIVTDTAAVHALQGHDSRHAFDFVEASKARSLLDFVESKKTISELEKSFGPVARSLSASEIQSRLPEQVQVVQYAVLPDRLAIWTISKTRFDLIERPITATELEKKIVSYRASVLNKDPPEEIRKAAAELYSLLIPSDLDPEKQLCLVADKSLHQLPFASLVSPAGRYLIEDFALFYAPSASVLVVATENARRKEQTINERVLSIGNPTFDREENPNLTDLPEAETEAKVIAGNYLKPLEFVGSEATKEKFLLNFGAVEVVHFAGHFVANRLSPGNSKLLFAGSALRSNQLSEYKVRRAKLFVLSACETGFERYNKSEGAIGVARTFLALGVPLVVASQWKVDSEPTRDLMIAFHRNRKQAGLSSAESLRRAQLEVLSRDGTRAPFYWAAFSLFGGYAKY